MWSQIEALGPVAEPPEVDTAGHRADRNSGGQAVRPRSLLAGFDPLPIMEMNRRSTSVVSGASCE
jgi:hypothetical protein